MVKLDGNRVKLNVKFILGDDNSYRENLNKRSEFIVWAVNNRDREFTVEGKYFGDYYKLEGESRLFSKKELIFIEE